MFKKLAALVCAGMLFFAGMGIPFAKDNLSVGQKLAYRYTEVEEMDVVRWTIRTSTPNILMLLFFGIWHSSQMLEDGKVLTTRLSMFGGYHLLAVPQEDGRYMLYLERIGDGDTEVDAVGIQAHGDNVRALRYIQDDKPSVYTAMYHKYMSAITFGIAHKTVIPTTTGIKCIGGIDGSET